MSEQAEHLISGPNEVHYPGKDLTAWEWFIAGKRVEVRVSNTALEAQGGLSDRAQEAIETKGESEIRRFLGWKTPPEWVEFSTDNLPWIEGGEVDE